MAKNIDSDEEFEQAQQWGYSFFHGDFFTKPAPSPDGEIAPTKLGHLKLLAEIGRPTLSYDELADVIQADVALTFKLLRFMNSAWFGFSHEIKSIKHALVLLGPAEIRRWVAMATIQSVGADKPNELLLLSLTRAKVAEGLAGDVELTDASTELFLLGMFSVIDALTDTPMPGVLADLPLADPVKQALLKKDGKYRDILELMLAYEAGQWDAFSDIVAKLGLDEQVIPGLFRSGLKWAHEALAEL